MTTGQQWYAEYLRSPRWRFLRWARRRIDGNRCRDCGATGWLETHHESYDFRGWPGLAGFIIELGDTVIVCRSCHEKRHSND